MKGYIFCPYCASELKTIIQENKPFKHCSECSWTHYPTPHIAVAGVIISDNKVVMVKRNREPFKDTWMFPAGFLEFGEHPEQTLFREVREETGLRVVDWDLMEIIQSTSDPRSPKHLVLFYKAKAIGEIKNNDQDENSRVEWKSLDEDIEIGFPHHKVIFHKLKDR